MKRILRDIIFECLSAFIKGRSIFENSLLAHELIRNFNKQGADKFNLKLDLHKAYNKINRQFILHMLRIMEFPNKAVDLITECITTPTFSILLNGITRVDMPMSSNKITDGEYAELVSKTRGKLKGGV